MRKVLERHLTHVLVAGFLLAGHASAQIPLGGEFRVNETTTFGQYGPAVAWGSSGFIVTWTSAFQDASGSGIYAHRYQGSGDPFGGEFRVNTFTPNKQDRSQVVSDAAGAFVVVWGSRNEDGSYYGVFGQRLSSSGGGAGAEFRVNSYTTSSQDRATIASSGGGFVVAWTSSSQDAGTGVFAQRFDSGGAPLGPEFRVNTYTTSYQFQPSVAASPTQAFVVVWSSKGQDGSGYGVFAQRYASSGDPDGGEFRVSTFTTNDQAFPRAAVSPSGDFVVVWKSTFQDGPRDAIFGQRFASSGGPLGGEFTVSTAPSSQQYPAVAFDSSGRFVIAWQGSVYLQAENIFGKVYSSAGAPLSGDFLVSSFTPDFQSKPALAFAPGGDFVVTWASTNQDGSAEGVFAQRFCLDVLSSVSVSTLGSLAVCTNSVPGGVAFVTDTGGGTTAHQ
ncbi:MAG TPA: hypothetical protein VGR00_11705, partial [Thermoanaerobaculia bacterium]|nr:hypothetical protein [Thermoanaerobaculia bacterium]